MQNTKLLLALLLSLTLSASGCAMKKSKSSDCHSAEAQEAWKQAATPGEEHKALEPLVGEWDTETTFRGSAEGPEEVTTGTASHKWILGGRFIQESYDGKAMGYPFQGFGLIGYDRINDNLVATWTDSMSTSIMQSTGEIKDGGKLFSWKGHYMDPVTRKPKQTRAVNRIVSPDENVYEMFETDADGKEFKSLVVKYTRRPEAAAKVAPVAQKSAAVEKKAATVKQ